MRPEDKITSVKGIGARTGELLSRLGIETVADFLTHYPRDYRRYGEASSIADMTWDEREPAAYCVQVTDRPRLIKRGRTAVVSLELRADGASLQVIWFHSPYIRQQLEPGQTVILYGKIIHKGKKRLLEHPDIYTEDQYAVMRSRMQPVYGLTGGLTQNFFVKYMDRLLSEKMLFRDMLPVSVREKYQLAEYNYALQQIHFPADEEACREARKRLVFDEFLLFALSVKLLKKENHQIASQYVIGPSSLAQRLAASLPYTLTGAQMRVWREIEADMAGTTVMNRLVQGDVGSGKTMIAALAMCAAAEAGYQSCLMAPTEVLARQHYENLSRLYEPLGIRTVLLTGSMTAAQKKRTYAAIEACEADVIVGTQALFQEKAVYAKLALIITDEQHRFGVRQRERLAMKSGSGEPHVLVMSATPIPRTLAIILYSDLDISVIDEKPADRLPIKNCVVGTGYRPTAYRFLEKQVRMGHQVYVICPMVEESENVDAEDVQHYAEKLRKELPPDIRIEYLHGQMKADEKNHLMECFARGEIQILVSTTVIEVGVDVPNATVMMIENAERFGLAQLHQLRGRVGRGEAQSYCIFVHGQDSQKVKERLKIMLQTNDGFKIAAEDLKLRGPGDMFGIRQSGSMLFALGDVYTDASCLMAAGAAADEILGQEGGLDRPEYAALKERAASCLVGNRESVIL